ncbi:MAG: alpha/beta fold hydrolase [Kiritimatiellae bacterium]|nr:alpha/beta fold hydrolase [Kiritimatiellia bacterium]
MLHVLAYRHARAMLHYASGGTRTAPPETLSLLAKSRVLLAGVQIPRPEDNRPPTALAPDARSVGILVSGGVALCAWVADRGPGAPLVILFHGYSTEKNRLLLEAREWHALGASILLVDFRGSGQSSESITTLGWLEAEDVAAAVQYAQARIPHSRLILYGQSMGSAAILRAVSAHGVAPDAVVLESVFDTMLNAIRARFRAMRLPVFPSANLLAFWGGHQFGFNAFAHNPVDYAVSLRCPALFLHGSDDPRAPVDQARRVFENVPGNRKTFVTFDGVGHASYAAAHPVEWNTAVTEFLGLPAADPQGDSP